ncbi:MAG: hypothetical protein P9L97_08805 [Candidatus Tenebribacter davisii]|nr:hypothetical protein [Candidatus Tenebribacter davisii]
MKNLILFLMILLIMSCSLDRTNPLDPLVSNKEAPGRVTGIQVMTTENNTIFITWNSMQAATGYYIYRSQSYDGFYALIIDIEKGLNDIHEYEDLDVDIPGNFYWYKMSAYIIIDEEQLEGYRSEPITWH